MDTPSYYSSRYRALAALTGAFAVVLNRLKTDIWEVLSNPGFYISVLLSFAIAFLLIEASHRYTLLVDRRYSWQRQYRERQVLHLLVGPLFTSLMAIALAYGLITIMGRDFIQSNYLSREFPLIASMLFLVHFNYRDRSMKRYVRDMEQYIAQLNQRLNHKRTRLRIQEEHLQLQLQRNSELLAQRDTQASTLKRMEDALKLTRDPERPDPPKGSIKVDYKNERITVFFAKVAYFKKEGNIVAIFMKSGQRFITRLTLRELKAKLDGYWFFQTHASYIVNRSAIKPCERDVGNGVLSIEVNAGAKHWVKVSRDRKAAYRSWFATGTTIPELLESPD